MIRKFAVEFLGTAILVFFAVDVATLMFGFKFAGGSVAAGVVATALAFGLTLLALVYLIGPVSGCHINPAVTMGALLTGRIKVTEAAGPRCSPRPGCWPGPARWSPGGGHADASADPPGDMADSGPCPPHRCRRHRRNQLSSGQ